MAHDRIGKWRLIRKLGGGGQANVFLAFDEGALQLSAWDMAELHKIVEFTLSMKDGREQGRPEAERETIHINDQSGVGDAIASLLDLAHQLHLGALKQLKPAGEWSRDPQHQTERLLQEIDVLQGVRHPNLQNLLDADKTAPWLVTEYYPRGTLGENRNLYADQAENALRGVRGLAHGVAALHKKRIMHRDIKPENVFLSSDGRLILGDLGLILPSEQHSRLTQSGDNAGTYAWMPPWAMNVRHDFMPTFDVYGLGKILWFMLSRRELLPPEYVDGDIARIIDDQRAVRVLEHVIGRCVVLQKEDCIPTVAELINELDDAIEAINAPAPPAELKMVAHAMSRPGPLYLVTVDASRSRGAPDVYPKANWKFLHPNAHGRGVAMPGIRSSGSVTREPAIADDDLWRDFIAFDKDLGRWLIQPQDPLSFDNFIELFGFGPVSLRDARYLQVAIEVSDRSKFRLYLGFIENRWIAYSDEKDEGKINQQPEYAIRVPELSPSNTMKYITRDIRKDAGATWGADGIDLSAVEGVRIRGGFRLLSLRIV